MNSQPKCQQTHRRKATSRLPQTPCEQPRPIQRTPSASSAGLLRSPIAEPGKSQGQKTPKNSRTAAQVQHSRALPHHFVSIMQNNIPRTLKHTMPSTRFDTALLAALRLCISSRAGRHLCIGIENLRLPLLSDLLRGGVLLGGLLFTAGAPCWCRPFAIQPGSRRAGITRPLMPLSALSATSTRCSSLVRILVLASPRLLCLAIMGMCLELIAEPCSEPCEPSGTGCPSPRMSHQAAQ